MKKRIKIPLIGIPVLGAILTGAYSYVSSGHFIKAHVLPRVADALGTEVEAGEVSFSALRRLELNDLRVGPAADPLVRADTILVEYRALSLLSRKLEINGVLLEGITVDATPEKLAALQKEEPPAAEKDQKKPGKEKAPPELLIRNVRISNLAVDYVDAGAPNGPLEVHIPQFDLELPLLAGGHAFDLSMKSRARIVGPALDAAVQSITLSLSGMLAKDLMPESISLAFHLDDIAGSAGPVVLDDRRIELTADIAGNAEQYEIRRLALTEYAGEIRDAELSTVGSLALEPLCASVDITVNIPPGSLLDLVGALAGGIEFGRTAIAYTGHVEMPAPKQLTSRGDLSVRDLTAAVPSAGVPAIRPLQLSARHDVAFDFGAHSVNVNQLDASVQEGGREVVQVSMNRPMALDLNNPGGDASAQLGIRVNRLDLTLLNAFLAGRSDLRIISGELNRSVQIDLVQGGRQVKLNVGGGGIDRLQVEQGGRRIGPFRINHEAVMNVNDFNAVQMESFQVELIPLALGMTPAARINLSGGLMLKPQPSGSLTAAFEGEGQRLLAAAKPFVEDSVMSIGEARFHGTLGADGPQDPDKPLHLNLTAAVEGLDPVLRDGSHTAFPVSTDLSLDFDYRTAGMVKVNRLGFKLHRMGQSDPMLNLGAVANIDTTQNPGVKNSIDVAITGLTRIDELFGLWIKPATVETPSPAGSVEKEASPPPSLWIESRLSMEHATYEQMDIQNVDSLAIYRDGKVDLEKLDAVINGGTVSATGTCDLSNPAKPAYDMAIKGSAVQFSPVLSTFLPNTAFHLRGALESADVRFKGTGFDLASMQENLTAGLDLQLDQLSIEHIGGPLGRLTDTLLLNIFELGMQDMVFADAGLKAAVDREHYGDGNIHVEQLLMRAPQFMIDGSGIVEFGGNWYPDIELQTGFSDGKSADLQRKGFAIASEKGPSGYHEGPVIPLRGDLKDLNNQARLVTETLVNAGKISAEEAAQADLANEMLGILKGEGDLGDLFDSESDAGKALGNVLKGVLEDQKKKGGEDDATEVIGNVLKGIFGN